MAQSTVVVLLRPVRFRFRPSFDRQHACSQVELPLFHDAWKTRRRRFPRNMIMPWNASTAIPLMAEAYEGRNGYDRPTGVISESIKLQDRSAKYWKQPDLGDCGYSSRSIAKMENQRGEGLSIRCRFRRHMLIHSMFIDDGIIMTCILVSAKLYGLGIVRICYIPDLARCLPDHKLVCS